MTYTLLRDPPFSHQGFGGGLATAQKGRFLRGYRRLALMHSSLRRSLLHSGRLKASLQISRWLNTHGEASSR